MNILEGQLRKAIDELDRTLAFLGLLFSLILTIWLAITIGRPIYVLVGLLCFLACAGYLLIRTNLSLSTIPSLLQTTGSPRFYLVLNIVFFLLLSYSIVSIYLSPEIYTRPLGYFISTTLMAAIVAVEILFLSPRKSHTYFALFKIVTIALSLRWSQQLIFPSIVGIDPWVHQWFTHQILDAGFVPEGWGYSKMPLFHLMAGATMLITDLGYKMAVMLSIGLLQVVCDTLFVFLLGRFILSPKIGLLAALLLGMANHHIMFGFWTIPNTTAAILILPIMYLLFKIRNEKPILAISLSLLFMTALILTHTIVATCLAILLFVFWAGFRIYAGLYRSKFQLPVSLPIAALFTLGMFAYWTYASGHITELALFIKQGFGEEIWLRSRLLDEAGQHAAGVPFSEQLFNNMGPFLFFALSFIGCFYMISKRFGNSYSFAAAIGGAIVLGLGFFPLITGHDIIQHRWLYFAQIMLAVPLSLTLLLLCGVLKNKHAKAALLLVPVSLLSFLMIMSPVANLDNRSFSPNTVVRYASTVSELEAVNTISNISDKQMGSDWYYSLLSFELQGINITEIDYYLYQGDFSQHQHMIIVIREEIVKHPFHTPFGGIIKLRYDPRPSLLAQGFSRIYSNGPVTAFAFR